MKKRIIVIGGGYAGTEVIRQLVNRGVQNVEVELVSNKTHFENTIGGAEIISDKVKPEELMYDLKQLADYWNFGLVIGTVENIDLKDKIVKAGNTQKQYDILVLAMGSEPNFFGVPGANLTQAAYHLSDFKIINEKLKQLILNSPNVVIAGAGFVGLESAAEILDLFNLIKGKVNLTVIEKMNTVLPAYNNATARRMTYDYFTSRGVKFIIGNGIKKVEEGKLILEKGDSIESDFTVWTAGVKGCLVSSEIAGANLIRGCVGVDDRLLIREADDAFALGDVAYVEIGGKEATKMAGEALEQAKTAAKNIALMIAGKKPSISHVPVYTTDYPKALLSMGEGKAMLIMGPEFVSAGATEYFLKKRVDFQEIMDRFPS